MIGHVRMHRIDDAKIVDHFGYLRKEVACPDSTFSFLGEVERGLHQGSRLSLGAKVLAGNFFAVKFLQLWFVVE